MWRRFSIKKTDKKCRFTPVDICQKYIASLQCIYNYEKQEIETGVSIDGYWRRLMVKLLVEHCEGIIASINLAIINMMTLANVSWCYLGQLLAWSYLSSHMLTR